jgi:UDP-N-acetylglucosamine 3-dehydrogenase
MLLMGEGLPTEPSTPPSETFGDQHWSDKETTLKRIGIVGSGLMGSWHAARLQQLQSDQKGRIELAGFFDVSTEAAAKAVTEYGGKVFEVFEEFLSAVDVVDVCTPTPYHKEPVLAAAAAGKHVICEKPLARHLSDAAEMVSACETNGVRLFVAQVVRFFGQFSRAKATLESGSIGRPGVIRTVRGGGPPDPNQRTWFTDFGMSGGVIMDVSIHDLDFARWCFGDVERVFARGLTFAGVEPYDHALITLRFKNGAIGHIEGSWAYPPGRFRTRFEIACDEGLVEWDSTDPAPLTVTLKPADSGASVAIPQYHDPLAPEDDPYYLQLEHFVDCLESGDEFLVTPKDGLQAVKLSLAAIESIRTGQPVYLDKFEERTHQ